MLPASPVTAERSSVPARLSIQTNGRWASTVHRVLAPEPGSAAATAARLSIPFFAG